MAGGFITIHGIDGVGKTTTAELTVARFMSEGRASVGWSEFSRSAGIDYLPSVRSDFSASVTKKALEGIAVENTLPSGIVIVKDRWLIDVMAAHAFEGDGGDVSDLGVLKPDLSVVLTCDEQTRMQKRILSRPNPTPEDLIPKIEGTRAHFFERYLLENIGRVAKRVAIIDTTNATPEDVAAQILTEYERGRSI